MGVLGKLMTVPREMCPGQFVPLNTTSLPKRGTTTAQDFLLSSPISRESGHFSGQQKNWDERRKTGKGEEGAKINLVRRGRKRRGFHEVWEYTAQLPSSQSRKCIELLGGFSLPTTFQTD